MVQVPIKYGLESPNQDKVNTYYTPSPVSGQNWWRLTVIRGLDCCRSVREYSQATYQLLPKSSVLIPALWEQLELLARMLSLTRCAIGLILIVIDQPQYYACCDTEVKLTNKATWAHICKVTLNLLSSREPPANAAISWHSSRMSWGCRFFVGSKGYSAPSEPTIFK